jgi:hypothetical protein
VSYNSYVRADTHIVIDTVGIRFIIDVSIVIIQLIFYSTLLLGELILRLFELNDKNIVQNKLHHKNVNINNNLFNLNNEVGIDYGI